MANFDRSNPNDQALTLWLTLAGSILRQPNAKQTSTSPRESIGYNQQRPFFITYLAKLPPIGLNRPICARSDALTPWVTRDHAGPFCTIGHRTARVFCANRVNRRRPRPDGLVEASSGRQIRTKRKMEAYPSDTEFFVARRTSFKDWPV